MPTRLRAVQADLATLTVDAIVNAANESLLGGGGVDGAVRRAAGPELVRSCCRRALQEAAAGCVSSAFPCVSTGVYGYPLEPAARLAIAAVRTTLAELPHIRAVVFCCHSAADHAVYQRLLRSDEHPRSTEDE